MPKIERLYYLQPDVVYLAKDLLGKVIHTNINGKITSGIISETEAYNGIIDKGSHAYNGRRTKRTEITYWQGGTAYVYLCYGMYPLFNVVTNEVDIPHAILIRGIIPLDGIDEMLLRTGKNKISKDFTNGPGKVAKALGIITEHTGIDLTGNTIWLSDENTIIPESEIIACPRVGINYAGEDALLQYRFILKL